MMESLCSPQADQQAMIAAAAELSALLAPWAAKEPSIRRVYLFGSRARGDHRPDSDYDLAILYRLSLDDLQIAGGDRYTAEMWAWDDNLLRWQPDIESLLSPGAVLHLHQMRKKLDARVWAGLKACRYRVV